MTEDNCKFEKPLVDPVDSPCIDTVSTDCVRYPSEAYSGIGISSQMRLTEILQILFQAQIGGTVLTSITTNDSDTVAFTGDGNIGSPLQADVIFTPTIVSKILDQISLDNILRASLDTLVRDVLEPFDPTSNCTIDASNVFMRISPSNNQYAEIGINDQDPVARYQISTWNTSSLTQSWVMHQILQVGGNHTLFMSFMRIARIEWRIRKYCGTDVNGLQIYTNWIHGNDILPF